mgnify:CR=1 FL=1
MSNLYLDLWPVIPIGLSLITLGFTQKNPILLSFGICVLLMPIIMFILFVNGWGTNPNRALPVSISSLILAFSFLIVQYIK